MNKNVMCTLVATSLAVLLIASAQAGGNKGATMQNANVVGQSPGGPVVSPGGAKLIRSKNGITASITMPTPMSGSYNYPTANPFQTVTPVPGTPEVFTGWFFFFNNPENCAVPHGCIPPAPGTPAPNDFSEGRGGVYNFAGHATSGSGSLNLVGHIAVGEQQFGGPFALDNPAGAEVHLAIAPHGVLVPALMPEQIGTPVGNPSFWWLALLPAPAE